MNSLEEHQKSVQGKLHGEHRGKFGVGEITTGKVFRMSLPIFVELLLQLLVGNIDQFMVSRYSQDAVTAVGNGDQIMKIVIIVLNTMSAATTILLTQYIGAKNQRMKSVTCTTSMGLIGCFSLVLTGIVVGLHRQIFALMHVDESVMEQACVYIVWIGCFILVQGLYLNLASILRSFSLMKEVMATSILMNVLNIFGNAALLNGYFGLPKLGIVGVAISTDVSKFVGLVILFAVFHKKVDAQLGFRFLKPFPADTLKRLLYIALPSGGEGLSYNLSQLVILSFINPYGTMVVNTKIYASMIANVSYVYANAIAQATQIAVGYLLGAGRKDEVSRRVWTTVLVSFCVCVGVTVISYLNSERVFGIFTNDARVLALGRKILRIEIILECGRAMNIVLVKMLCSTGDVVMPITVGIFCQWFVAALLGYIMGTLCGLGLLGIWIAMAVDECSRGIVFIFRFKSGKWRSKQVI